MLNNLIESSSHRREFKRRGSFFLFTTATYVLLFVIAGVMSIYAYDARMEDQTTEFITMLSPLDLATPRPPVPARNTAPPRRNNSGQNYAEREIAMASVNNPRIVPEKTSTQPNRNKPLPESGLYRITGRDVDPVRPAGTGDAEHGSGELI